jgi:hypothetical protein
LITHGGERPITNPNVRRRAALRPHIEYGEPAPRLATRRIVTTSLGHSEDQPPPLPPRRNRRAARGSTDSPTTPGAVDRRRPHRRPRYRPAPARPRSPFASARCEGRRCRRTGGRCRQVWLDWPVRGHGEADQAELAAEADGAVGVVSLASHLGTSRLTTTSEPSTLKPLLPPSLVRTMSESNSMIEPSEPRCRGRHDR